ncbi:unnamed protein product [Amoebophrya sp. A25]|nr:unnamed protein product [Amoebophrya sp. A25]|eukprot:GSA25T00009819001.1
MSFVQGRSFYRMEALYNWISRRVTLTVSTDEMSDCGRKPH